MVNEDRSGRQNPRSKGRRGAEAARTGRSRAPIDYIAVEQSPQFVALRRKHRRFVFPLAVGFLVWYFAFVLLAAYSPGFMATPVFGKVNVGILLGLAQFVSTFAITTWYVSRANRDFDPLAADIRSTLEAQEGNRK